MRAHIGGHEHHAGADPGERVRPDDALEAEQVPEHECRAHAHDELDEAGDRRDDGRPEPCSAPRRMNRIATSRYQSPVDVQHEGREVDDLLRPVTHEQAHQVAAERDQQCAEHEPRDHRHDESLPHTAADAVRPARAGFCAAYIDAASPSDCSSATAGPSTRDAVV